jgi:hypothetical protein
LESDEVGNGGPERVTFSRQDWEKSAASAAFGITKTRPAVKPKIPGLKAILIADDTFEDMKLWAKSLTNRPAIDLPELASAALSIVMADESLKSCAVKELLGLRIIKAQADLKRMP